MKPKKKNILILGSGFCGLQAAIELAKQLHNEPNYQIIVIDKNTSHIFHADLYEIAAAYNKKITTSCLHKLSETVSIPLKKTLKHKNIEVVQDEILAIDKIEKTIQLKKNGDYHYEYLVMALGSVINFYNIPGLEEHSLPLKTLHDALALSCHLDQYFKNYHESHQTHDVHIVIGGGGFTGVEYACEVVGYVNKLSKKYRFAKNKAKITIVQGGDQFIGLGKKVSDIALKRFNDLNIKPISNHRISKYDGKTLELMAPDQTIRQIPADILVWTGGIKANPLLNNFEKRDKSGCLEVGPTLECTHYPQIYAGGDNASVFDAKSESYLPKIAHFAIQQGKVIGENIAASIRGETQKTYHPHFKGFIVALGGKYFVFQRKNITLKGIIPYLIRKVEIFLYFKSLISFKWAYKKIITNEHIFEQNDENN